MSLTAASAATISLTGNALAISSADSCEEATSYGTMTEEVFGQSWQDSVMALAISNSEITMGVDDTQTLQVYAVFKGSIASQLVDNADLTFAVETTPASTITSGIEVGTNTGIITTASATAGSCVVSATLTGYETVPPALATVTVTG